MENNFIEKKKLTIIDRTLSELYKMNNNIKRLEVIYFCWLLDNIGVNLIEINIDILKVIKKLPTGINFMCRVENQEDLDLCKEFKIASIVLKKGVIALLDIDKVNEYNFNITLEIDLDNIDDILEKIKSEKFIIYKNIVNTVRLTGLKSNMPINWFEKVNEFIQIYNVKVDICPKNDHYNATSTAIESIMANVDTITMSFLGTGEGAGFAALEEVLVGVKVITKGDFDVNLGVFKELALSYKKLSKMDIEGDKAIVGSNIFNYESGIHANGIEKDAYTYEPYEPQLVGLKRNLKIGKHSGTTSVIKKLKDLGLSCKKGKSAENLLEGVRDKSIQLKRDLDDNELIELYIDRYL